MYGLIITFESELLLGPEHVSVEVLIELVINKCEIEEGRHIRFNQVVSALQFLSYQARLSWEYILLIIMIDGSLCQKRHVSDDPGFRALIPRNR